MVWVVHDAVVAAPQSGEAPNSAVDEWRPGARARDDAGLQSRRLELGHDALEIRGALLDRGLALGEVLDVLMAAAIELHAGVFQRFEFGDLLRQFDRGLRRGNAGTVDPGIDVD